MLKPEKLVCFLRRQCLSALFLLGALAIAPAQTMTSFETPSDFIRPSLYANLATVTPATLGTTDGAQSAKVSFQATSVKSYPSLTLFNLAHFSFATAGGLAIDITNPGSTDISFSMNIVDGLGNSIEYPATLEAGGSATYRVGDPASANPLTYGLYQLPNPLPGSRDIKGFKSGSLDYNNVSQVVIFLRGPNAATALFVDNVRLIPAYSLDSLLLGMADQFGQYSKATWPGKLNSVSEFAARVSADRQDLSANPNSSTRSIYGGAIALSTKTATGYFRTLSANNKWWLVDPAGYRFFSMGINAMGFETTYTTGRESLFSWLPKLPDPLSTDRPEYLANHYLPTITAYGNKPGWTYDFYGANLERKYGSDYVNQWKDNSLTRLTSWGFNTVGGFSNGMVANGRVPYTIVLSTQRTPNKIDAGYGHGSLVPDPWDPKFAPYFADALRNYANTTKNDPYLLGYFVDNELAWVGQGPNAQYGLAAGVMKLPSTVPAKKVFCDTIRYKYVTIQAVNAAWGTNYPSLASFNNPTDFPTNINAALANDLDLFILKFSAQYFNTIRAEIRKQDTHHLYLGCRFGNYSQSIMSMAAKYADVLSFNVYADTVDPTKWAFLNQFNKPCIISEFHFGATDRGGLFGGLVQKYTQSQRALSYQNYVRSVIDNPIFVGCHWYQYVDQPTTGRQYDGENAAVGLVDATDTPYSELISQCRVTNREVYTRRGP